MAYFEPAVITRAGVNMIANDIAGIGNIEFVKMVSGAGEYTEEEKSKNALAERTALKDQRQEFVFNAIEVKSEKSVLLKSVISNQTLEEGYRITEVGIYAREKGTEGDGFLYSLALAIEADFLPPFNGLNPSEIVQEYYATVSDAATVSIISAPGAFALYEDMKTLENTFSEKIKGLDDNLGNSENVYSDKATYVLGDYCIYNGQMYKCISPIDEPEEWNELHWEKTTMAKELVFLANKEIELVDPMTATKAGFAADAKLTGDVLKTLNTKMSSFEQAKSTIVNSALGKALGLTASMTLATIASKIAGVANRGAWTNTITTANGKATIPAGYHNGSGYVQASGLYVPPTSLSGSVTLSIPTNSMWQEVSKVITFSSPFMSVPSVSLGWSDTTYKYTGGVRNVSKTGFTIYYSPNTNRAAYTVTASWLAK